MTIKNIEIKRENLDHPPTMTITLELAYLAAAELPYGTNKNERYAEYENLLKQEFSDSLLYYCVRSKDRVIRALIGDEEYVKEIEDYLRDNNLLSFGASDN